jgi:sugar phosphate permease
MVVGAAVLSAVNSSLLLASFGAYIDKMERTLGWSRTVLAGAYSMSRSQSGFLAPLEGALLDKIGPRATIQIGAALMGGGFIALSQVHNVVLFYAVFAVMAVGSALMTQITIIATLGRWFIRNRTKAISFSLAGASMGGVVGVPLVALGLDTYGWRTMAFTSGLIVLVVGIAVSFLFSYSPEHRGLRPDGDPVPPDDATAQQSGPEVRPQRRANRPELEGFTMREAARTKAFWIIGTAQLTATVAVSIIQLHFILFLKDEYGMTTTRAATVLSVVLAAQFTGHIVGGFVSDKLNKRFVAAGAMAVTGVGLLILSTTPPLIFVFMFAVMHGTSAGFRYPVIESMKAEYFGRKRLGTILGWASVFSSIGTTAGPLVGAVIRDATGTYNLAFLSIAALSFLGFVGFMLATKPQMPGANKLVQKSASQAG